MSLRINHNLAALNAHRNLVNTMNALSSSMQKLSSGYRINQGSDDPAGLVISEQFRAQIAGLNRAVNNSEGSINMIQTAEGALSEINNLLISMRELAIHAANEGFNDADQLAADQAEIDNAIKTIDRIASNTQFGTKLLLDGSKANTATITSANSSLVAIKASYLTDGTHSIAATKTADSTSTLNTTSLGLSLYNTDGDPYNLTDGIHNLDVLQASDVAKKTSTQIAITDAFSQNMTVAAAATQAIIVGGTTATAAQTVATANEGTYTTTLNYQEDNESPTGSQTLSVSIASTDTISGVVDAYNDAIRANSFLNGKIVAYNSDQGAGAFGLEFRSANEGAQYSLNVTAVTGAEGFAKVTVSKDRGVSKNELAMTINTVENAATTATITTAATTFTSMAHLASVLDTALNTAFGTVDNGAPNDVDAAVFNTDKMQFRTWDEGSDYSIKLNTTDTAGTASGELQYALGLTPDSLSNTGTDTLVSFDNYTTAISSVKYGSIDSVTLGNKASGETGRGTVSLTVNTAVNGINMGNLLLDVTAAKYNVRLDGGPAATITAGIDSTIYNADRSESLVLKYDLTSQGGTETIYNTDQSLVFQIGANVGQTASVSMRNMAASSLGRNIAGNTFLSLAQINVTNSQGAQDSQAIIDACINEVSTTRGTLGSFQKNTLESNLRNLRIAAQNLTASESFIRDTDMAREMSEFTKSQILVQAGTAMLAQANQVPQIVLSLFG